MNGSSHPEHTIRRIQTSRKHAEIWFSENNSDRYDICPKWCRLLEAVEKVPGLDDWITNYGYAGCRISKSDCDIAITFPRPATSEAFAEQYQLRAGMSADEFANCGLIPESCDCAAQGCDGWRMASHAPPLHVPPAGSTE